MHSKTTHFVAKQEISVEDCLIQHFRFSKIEVIEILKLGALYVGKNRINKNEVLKAGSHLQIYLSPKRYPVKEIDWKTRIVSETSQFLILNKPSGIPVHSTPENLIENVQFELEKKMDSKIYLTQRLDTPVSGLMLIAKTPEFQVRFNQLLSQKKINKVYKALVEKDVPLGLHRHFMDPAEKIPRVVSTESKKDWLDCELKVLASRPIAMGEKRKYFELEIVLLTGRTHQIRAQLAYLGSPVLGDLAYGGRKKEGFKPSRIALASVNLSWNIHEQKYSYNLIPDYESKLKTN